MTLDRNKILSSDDAKRISVDVPEWGGSVCIKVISGTERDEYEQECFANKEKMENIRAKLLVRALCDEKNNRIFSNDDVIELGKKSAIVLDRLFSIALKHNALHPSAVEDAKKN